MKTLHEGGRYLFFPPNGHYSDNGGVVGGEPLLGNVTIVIFGMAWGGKSVSRGLTIGDRVLSPGSCVRKVKKSLWAPTTHR